MKTPNIRQAVLLMAGLINQIPGSNAKEMLNQDLLNRPVLPNNPPRGRATAKPGAFNPGGDCRRAQRLLKRYRKQMNKGAIFRHPKRLLAYWKATRKQHDASKCIVSEHSH